MSIMKSNQTGDIYYFNIMSVVPVQLESWTWIIQLEPMEHDHVKILQISQAAHVSIAQRWLRSQVQCSLGLHFVAEFFFSDANIAIVANFG